MLALAAVGWGIAAYLTNVHYEGLHALCLANGGCVQVQSSRYAKLAGIPVRDDRPPRDRARRACSRALPARGPLTAARQAARRARRRISCVVCKD